MTMTTRALRSPRSTSSSSVACSEVRNALEDIAKVIVAGQELVDAVAGVGSEIGEIRKDIVSIAGALLGIRRQLEINL